MLIDQQEKVLRIFRDEFYETGYERQLVKDNHQFVNFFEKTNLQETDSIPLVAFAKLPTSYQNACLGVFYANGSADPSVALKFKSLGAPQLFGIRSTSDKIHIDQWIIQANKNPVHQDSVRAEEIRHLFEAHRDEWSPESVFRAKTGMLTANSLQLDFVDTGLLPALEAEARNRLHSLVESIIEQADYSLSDIIQEKEKRSHTTLRIVFRLLAAKVLYDRELISDFTNPVEILKKVSAYYGETSDNLNLSDLAEKIRPISERIKDSFRFDNLSIDTLVYVYENTLVSEQQRNNLGIHSTPSYIADYIFERLPIEELDLNDRVVFEPMCGSATFLVAAMRRLNYLLPLEFSIEDRHRYYVPRLLGVEIDAFARETAKLCLMLADFPNSNGWHIEPGNVFLGDLLETYAKSSTIFVANPPFGRFSDEELEKLKDGGVTPKSKEKPSELLLRVLPELPNKALIGVVMPAPSFLDGKSYRDIRRLICNSCDILEMVALPDKAFTHADQETVVLLAQKNEYDPNKKLNFMFGRVREDDLKTFEWDRKIKERVLVSQNDICDDKQVADISFMIPSSLKLWNRLSAYPTLGDLTESDRGYECNITPVPSWKEFDGSIAVLCNAKHQLSPYMAEPMAYIEDNLDNRKGNSWDRPWQDPKVIVNRSSKSRGPWRITAVPDYKGIIPSQNFHVIWPVSSRWPREALQDVPNYIAAVLNGYVANAYLYEYTGKRDMQQRFLLKLPIPIPSPYGLRLTSNLVKAYQNLIKYGNLVEAKLVRKSIDQLVLRFYALTPDEEKRILRYFKDLSPLTLTKMQMDMMKNNSQPLSVDSTQPWAAIIGDVAVVTGEKLKEVKEKAQTQFPGIEFSYYLNPTTR